MTHEEIAMLIGTTRFILLFNEWEDKGIINIRTRLIAAKNPDALKAILVGLDK